MGATKNPRRSRWAPARIRNLAAVRERSGSAWLYNKSMNADLTIGQFQKHIADRYEKHDRARGIPGTWLHFSEEIGELARALARNDDRKNLEEEFADVFAWLCTLANINDV